MARKRRSKDSGPLQCVSHTAFKHGCVAGECSFFSAAALLEDRLSTIEALATQAYDFMGDDAGGELIHDSGLTLAGVLDTIRTLAKSIPETRFGIGGSLDADDERSDRPGAQLLAWLGVLAREEAPKKEEDPSPKLRVLRGQQGTANEAGAPPAGTSDPRPSPA